VKSFKFYRAPFLIRESHTSDGVVKATGRERRWRMWVPEKKSRAHK